MAPSTQTLPDPASMSGFAENILEGIGDDPRAGAYLIALSGDLGAGKTTLAQAIARVLGVTESVQSPTFVLARSYPLSGRFGFRKLVHMDAYRLEGPEDLRPLGWEDIVRDPAALVLLEWPERVGPLVPRPDLRISLETLPEGGRMAHIERRGV